MQKEEADVWVTIDIKSIVDPSGFHIGIHFLNRCSVVMQFGVSYLGKQTKVSYGFSDLYTSADGEGLTSLSWTSSNLRLNKPLLLEIMDLLLEEGSWTLMADHYSFFLFSPCSFSLERAFRKGLATLRHTLRGGVAFLSPLWPFVSCFSYDSRNINWVPRLDISAIDESPKHTMWGKPIVKQWTNNNGIRSQHIGNSMYYNSKQ